jgi:hypothetical protein
MIIFIRGQTYWLEHPEHGTIKATAVLVSENGESLAFLLKNPILLRSRMGAAIITTSLPVMIEDGVVTDLFSQSVWTVYATEPPIKLPTK